MRKFQISERTFRNFIKAVIAVLSVYIAFRCVNLISDNKIKGHAAAAANDASSVIAKEIVENSSVMTQYMLFVENHGDDITDAVKKKMLTAVVADYIKRSEYTYDTSDPGYDNVINLIYENINAKDASAGTAAQEETTGKENITDKKEKSVKTAAKTIVPIPKITGIVYTEKNIKTFKNLIDKFYTVTSATALYEKDLPIKKALDTKFEIKGNAKTPQILIYHTHSQEEFSNSTTDAKTRIIGVGDRLTEVLSEQFGYNVIHDKTKYDMVNGKLDRNEAYDQARDGVEKILKKNPTISLVLDVHRDGVNGKTRLITEVNGKTTAQIMFFNGMSRFKISGDIDYLYNKYRFENLALSLQMKLKAEAYYPGFTRRNYVNAYEYNLDVCRQCMLIEVGAQTNTYQEAKNAAEPLAVLIDMVLGKN